MLILKQSTASQTVLIGPFLDDTDFVSEETGLTIANTDIRLSKGGGNTVAKNSGGGTHDELGFYQITLDATDTDTVGPLQLYVSVAGALPVWHEYHVIEEDIYDSLFAASAAGFDSNQRVDVGSWLGTAVTSGTGGPDVNVNAISDDTTAAANLEAMFDDTGYNASNSTVGTVTTLTGHTAQTGDSFARLGAPAGASVSADIAAVQADTDDIQTRIPAATPIEGTADSGTTTTMVDAARTEADTDYWAGSWIKFTSGTISGQVRLITGFTPASDTITFTPAATQAVATNTYEIIPAGYIAEVLTLTGHTAQTGDNYARLGAPAGASVSADVASVQTDTTAIVADTNELQGDWTDGGRLDVIVDSILVDTAEIGAAGAGLTEAGGTGDQLTSLATAAALSTAQADLDTITGADGVNLLSATQASIDAIETDTNSLNDTKIPDTISLAAINAEVDTAFTTQMADSVPADGTIATREQAIYMITQFLTERAVSSTTVTVKKVDGSTSLFTLTLDDGTSPTSITRAS